MNRFLFVVISFLFVFITTGCSKNGAYGSEEAIKRGDIVYQNEVINIEKFEQFCNQFIDSEFSSLKSFFLTNKLYY